MNAVRFAPGAPARSAPIRFRSTLRAILVLVGLLAGVGPSMAAMAPADGRDLPTSADRGTPPGAAEEVATSEPGSFHGSSARSTLSATGLPFRSNAYATGSQPRTVTDADLNGDGYPDLIVPANGSNTTQIFFGQANGIYLATASVVLVGSAFNTQKAAVGDFNADGLPDLAIVHYFDGVDVWLQNGDGSFGAGGAPNTNLPAGGNFNRCVAAGDLNGDGTPDLAVLSETANLRVWLAPGAAGSWANGGDYWVDGTVATWVVLADIDEDGLLDAVTTNDAPFSIVSVLYGAGASPGLLFGDLYVFDTGPGPNTCAVVDLNGDTHLDVVTANWDNVGTVSVLLGTGTRDLQTVVTTPPLNQQQAEPFAVETGDATGDGIPDVIVANGIGGTVSVFPGNGTGALGSPRVVPVGYGARGIAVLDANLDGRLDIATSNLFANTVQVLTADGANELPGETFASGDDTPASFPLNDRFTGSVDAGDLNGDGHADLATTHATAGTVSVAFGSGTGAFGAPVQLTVGTDPQAVTIADLDSDGKRDLAVANRGGGNVTVLFGKGDGTFKGKVQFGVGKEPADLITADVNGDGRADLVTANFADNNVSVLLKNPGGGGFKSRINSAAHAGPHGVAAGDLNGDGKADLAVADSVAAGFSILYGLGNGSFQAPVFFFTGGAPVAVAIANWDQSGLPDVAVSNTGLNRVEIWSNLGFTFSRVLTSTTAFEPRDVLAQDLDGDGWLEVILASRLGQTFVVYPFTSAPPLGIRRWAFGAPGTSVVSCDANEDGSPDLVTLNPRNQSFNVLLNDLSGSPLAAGHAAVVRDDGGVRDVSLSPNPLNPTATLRFTVGIAGSLRVKLYDIHGRVVRTVLEENQAVIGERRVTIDGTDDHGRRLATGVYFFRIENAGMTTSGRLTLLK